MLAIGNQRSIYLDELQEQLQMKKKHRIERLAMMQLRVDAELDKRDFSELSTDKLAMLTIQTPKALKAEEQKCKITVVRDRFQASVLEEVARYAL